MTDRMRDMLRKWAAMLTQDEMSMDMFLFEGYTFPEGIELQEHVQRAVNEYAARQV